MKQKSLGAFNIFSDEKNWLLHILWCLIHKSGEILTFDWKTFYNCVIGNLNSEQLVLDQDWKSKNVILIGDEAENFGDIQHFFLQKIIGYFTFYRGQYKNLVKSWCFRPEKVMYNCVNGNLNS